MSKRFTATEKWDRPWFRDLPNEYKLLWIFICDKCDIAGIWYVDLKLASFSMGFEYDLSTAVSLFEKQITVLNCGSKWMINDFVAFQYGVLTPNNNFHRSVLKVIEDSGAGQGLTSPSAGSQVKDKVKDKVKVIEGGTGGVSAQAAFVTEFGELYTKMTGQPFDAQQKHYVRIAGYIKKHGIEALRQKAAILAAHCQLCDTFFTKSEGWSAYTIETLLAHWNRLIPQVRISNQEIKDQQTIENLKKIRERDARINSEIESVA